MNKQYELEFFYFPGCIVAANKLHDEHGDREQLALIDYCGLILWQKDPAGLPEEIRHNIPCLTSRIASGFGTVTASTRRRRPATCTGFIWNCTRRRAAGVCRMASRILPN